MTSQYLNIKIKLKLVSYIKQSSLITDSYDIPNFLIWLHFAIAQQDYLGVSLGVSSSEPSVDSSMIDVLSFKTLLGLIFG